MDRVIKWLFDATQLIAILLRTLYRRLIGESSAIDATTTVANPQVDSCHTLGSTAFTVGWFADWPTVSG